MDNKKKDSPQLEDFRDLVPLIQSFLPAKEAARTRVLSKAWQQAWYTMPALSFPQRVWLSREQENKFMTYIDHTLSRYRKDNIPLNSIYLDINIRDKKTASLAKKWIRSVASVSTLKNLELKIFCCAPSFTLTNRIFSGRNVNRVSIVLDTWMIGALWMSIDPVINCVDLRVLELSNVHIRGDVVNKLLSTCRLLEKISLRFYDEFKTLKVKNLVHLRELKIDSRGRNDILEIDNVPSLRLFSYDSLFEQRGKPLPFETSSLGGVRDLYLDSLVIDDTFLKMIQYNIPFLEKLTFRTRYFSQARLDITFVSLKSFTLELIKKDPIEIQVYAPKLNFFSYEGRAISSLYFPANAPQQIELKTSLFEDTIDHSFSFKMKKTMNLPSKFHIVKDFISPPLNLDVGVGVRSPHLDAVFTICHPSYARASFEGKVSYLCKIKIREVMNKKSKEGNWQDYLQDVTIKSFDNGKVYQIIGE